MIFWFKMQCGTHIVVKKFRDISVVQVVILINNYYTLTIKNYICIKRLRRNDHEPGNDRKGNIHSEKG